MTAKISLPNGESAMFKTKEEFAQFFAKRYGTNKTQTRAMEIAFLQLMSWDVEWIDESKPALYAFTWLTGGFNQVYALNVREAIAKAKAEFPNWAHRINEASFRRITNKAEIAEYYAAMPLMD